MPQPQKRIASLARGFNFGGDTPSHAILGISMAFDTDRTMFVPLIAAAVRESASLAGRDYVATGGQYTYLREVPREGEEPVWFIQTITVPPEGENEADFRERMIDLARPVLQSAIDEGVDRSRLPDPSTVEGLRDMAGAVILDKAFYLGGVSMIQSTDGEMAFGVLHTPFSYNIFDHNEETWQASAGYLTANAVMLG